VAEAAPLAEPLPLRMILDEAVKRGRRHFREMYLPVALPIAAFSALVPLMQVRWMRHVMGRPPDFSTLPTDIALLGTGLLLVVGGTVLGHLALGVAAVDAAAGRPISMRRAWTALLRPRALGTLALNWLAVALGTCLCCLPGIYAILLLTLVVPVMVEEGLFGTSAMARSTDLACYNPRKTLGDDPRLHVFLILFVGFLLDYAVNFVTQLPAVVVQQVLMFRAISSGQRVDPAELVGRLTWIQIPSALLGSLGRVAVQVYVSFGVALLFFEVRHRKEGADLESAIDSLGAPPEGPA
jgi:hypothetical protein